MSVVVLNDLKQQVKTRIDELQSFVKVKFGKTVPNVEITYDLSSIRTAGQAITNTYTNKFQIRLHPAALLSYGKDYIENTVVHEFAHLVQKQHYPSSKPHGDEWKRVMITLGKDPKRCHNMDLQGAITNYSNSVSGVSHAVPTKVRKVKTFEYKCGCMTHNLTVIRHNKVVRGDGSYTCKHCKTKLVRV